MVGEEMPRWLIIPWFILFYSSSSNRVCMRSLHWHTAFTGAEIGKEKDIPHVSFRDL